MQIHRRLATTTAATVTGAMLATLLTAGSPPSAAAPPSAAVRSLTPLCQTLSDMQTGKIVSHKVGEFDQVDALLGRLIPLADSSLRTDLESMRSTFAAIGQAQANGQSVVPAFQALTSPQLIEVEQRIADGLTAACGTGLAPSTTSSSTGDLSPSICPGWTQQANIFTGNRFPYTIDTSGANYWGFNSPVTPGGYIELHGQYPHARYFSILPNDQQTNNLHPQTDVYIDPDPGSANPFRGKMPAGAGRDYTVRFRFTAPPANPEPNTSYVGALKDGVTPNNYVLFVYRIYGSVLGRGPNSGGEPLPAITYYDAQGNVTKHFDQCTPYPNGTPKAPDKVQRFPSLPIPGPLAAKHPKLSLSSNYHVPVDLLANPDVLYANTFYSERRGKVFVVRAKALATPDTDGSEPVFAKHKQARGFTVCGYNFYAGYANQCLTDHQLNLDKKGYYTIVVSAEKPDNADRRGRANWIPLGPYLDGQITYRFFLRGQPMLKRLAAAIDTGEASRRLDRYIPKMAYCSMRVFERDGAEGCFGSRR
ncbi:hypothetical protein [Nocardioides dilutus]